MLAFTVLGLTGGELFVVGFILIAIVSARYWPLLGERLAVLLSGDRGRRGDARKG